MCPFDGFLNCIVFGWGEGKEWHQLRKWKCLECYFLGVRSLALERVDLEGDSVALVGSRLAEGGEGVEECPFPLEEAWP